MSVVTRFAPSPTGMLHIGNARTALFNWLIARHHGGKFVLRVEDTDQERSTQENVQIILDGMSYLGLDYDEGPFYQSQRMDIYRQAVDRLIAESKAYRCRCTTEELETKRRRAREEKRTYLYDGACRDKNFGPEQPHVVRFKMPPEGSTVVEDKVMDRVEVSNAELDDWIIARTDGTPTYNFCVVVDDADMGVTLVVRGADHLTNTHKQIPLYHALGLTPPAFAHMPLTLGADRSKLSKRHGATSLIEYQKMGYLPQAMRNFLARLGWSHGDQELFTDEELIAVFDTDGINQSNAIFDTDKLDWINATKLREMPPAEVIPYLLPFLLERGYAAENDPRLPQIIEQLADRSKTLVEMAEWAKMFYVVPDEYEPKAVKKWWRGEAKEIMQRFLAWLKEDDTLRPGTIMPFVEKMAADMELKLGKVAQPIRVAMTGAAASPPLDATLALIGREEVIRRLEKAIANYPE